MREAAAKRPDKNVAILLDTKGPEIRTGFFKESCNKKIHLKAGQDLELTTDYSFLGDETKFACTYDKLPASVKKGSTILIADGSLVLTVLEIKKDSVICNVENDQSIGERKNMNLPNVKVDLPVLQPKDIDDLQNFGVPNKVDFIAASFVQSAEDIHFIKKTLKESKHGDGSAIKATDPTLRPPSDHPAAPHRADRPPARTPHRAASAISLVPLPAGDCKD